MSFIVEIHTDGRVMSLSYTEPVLLSQALCDAGLSPAHPCGGRGVCGKCVVRATGELSPMTETERRGLGGADVEDRRLSCLAKAVGNTILYYNTTNGRLQGLLEGFSREFLMDPPRRGNGVGLAVDVGTTSVAAYLYDTETGALLAEKCVENPQRTKGADVISRILCALQGESAQLQAQITDCLSDLARELSEKAGVAMPGTRVIVGNTAMLSLATGTDVRPMAAAPFELPRAFGEWEDETYYPPCISAYVGADMTAAILTSDMCRDPNKTALLLDVGTNGEMALWHKGKLLCCSTAAGPAFEGAGISCGSLAIPGAICAVKAQDGQLTYETIGGRPAIGLCGTGLIDTAAALLELGILEDSGYMEEDASIGDSGLYLTRADIRQLQLAKAAIRAGVDTLLAQAGIGYDAVDTVYLAGGFGSYLHSDTCGAIGLIPPDLIGKIRVLGNAAGKGAAMMLLSREEMARAEEIAAMAETIELSSSAVFMEHYVDSMMF